MRGEEERMKTEMEAEGGCIGCGRRREGLGSGEGRWTNPGWGWGDK